MAGEWVGFDRLGATSIITATGKGTWLDPGQGGLVIQRGDETTALQRLQEKPGEIRLTVTLYGRLVRSLRKGEDLFQKQCIQISQAPFMYSPQ